MSDLATQTVVDWTTGLQLLRELNDLASINVTHRDGWTLKVSDEEAVVFFPGQGVVDVDQLVADEAFALTVPMLTPCTVCGEMHAHRCDPPAATA